MGAMIEGALRDAHHVERADGRRAAIDQLTAANDDGLVNEGTPHWRRWGGGGTSRGSRRRYLCRSRRCFSCRRLHSRSCAVRRWYELPPVDQRCVLNGASFGEVSEGARGEGEVKNGEGGVDVVAPAEKDSRR